MIFKIPPEYLQTLLLIAVGLFGAIVHATAQLKVARDTGSEFTIVDFIILTIIASFSGLVFGLLSTIYFDDIVPVILSTAFGAFLGMAGLNKISAVFLEFLASKVNKK